MSYYYPFNHPISAPSSSFAQTAITASSANPSITVNTASFASAFINPGPQGPSGSSPTLGECNPGPELIGPSGSSGSAGPQGDPATTCPAGTKQCSSLSQGGYGVVCIQIRAGSDAAHTICPSSTTGTVAIVGYPTRSLYVTYTATNGITLSAYPAVPVTVEVYDIDVDGYDATGGVRVCSNYVESSTFPNAVLGINETITSQGGNTLPNSAKYAFTFTDSPVGQLDVSIDGGTPTPRSTGTQWTEAGYSWVIEYDGDCQTIPT